ncbi:ABC transporter ATP-binding protein [Proteinivorax tanatarense]|uniref:ABC transporter ATP-binding protein n=1 Tax=Proteinivorax tanatarense TaxID=1260629 RepID=A0AAU7VRM1_9FIRM
MKLIMEQLKRDRGEILVCGRKFCEDEVAYKNSIGYVADTCYFPDSFTIREVVNTLESFYKEFDKEKFYGYLKKWSLPKNKTIKSFSKGMKVKLMFASVLSRKSELLILDEPTSGLDPVVRSEILEELQEYIACGRKSVLVSTHIMTDLEKVADYICFIHQGEIKINDLKDNVMTNYKMVKGGLDELTTTLKESLIGYKATQIGFEGLISTVESEKIKDSLFLEHPTLEEILIYHIKTGGEI